jgi:hypothetical protein
LVGAGTTTNWASRYSFACCYPGRLLRPGELIPESALRFVADQLGTTPEALTTYAARFQTPYEQLGILRDTFGFGDLTSQRRKLLEWLLPVSLATTNAVAVATALLDELRRGRIIVPGSSIVGGVHPERLRKLAREGARPKLGEQAHLVVGGQGALPPSICACSSASSPLVATILDATVHLTDDGVALFDRAALIKAKAGGADLDSAIATAVGWEKLAVALPKPSAWPDRTRRTYPPWLPVPGRCCTGSVPYSSTRSSFTPCPPQPRRCAPSNLLAHVAPLGWQHINITGDYLWDADAAIGPDGFRPLRAQNTSLVEAA